MRPPVCSLALALLLCACGGQTGGAAPRTEQDLYEAIARSDVRYALLTRDEHAVETQSAAGEIVRFSGVEDIDALAAVLSKEHIEHAVQERRAAGMRE